MAIHIRGGRIGEILYEGKAETLEVLQEARIVPGSGKPQGEVAQIAVYT